MKTYSYTSLVLAAGVVISSAIAGATARASENQQASDLAAATQSMHAFVNQVCSSGSQGYGSEEVLDSAAMTAAEDKCLESGTQFIMQLDPPYVTADRPDVRHLTLAYKAALTLRACSVILPSNLPAGEGNDWNDLQHQCLLKSALISETGEANTRMGGRLNILDENGGYLVYGYCGPGGFCVSRKVYGTDTRRLADIQALLAIQTNETNAAKATHEF